MEGIEIYFDGACNNEKDIITPMGIGVVAYYKGLEISSVSTAPILNGTSNVAEWLACVAAFDLALKLHGEYPSERIQMFSDSQVIVSQFNGKFQIQKESFNNYYDKAWEYARAIGRMFVSLDWIPRHLNERADELSKQSLLVSNSVKSTVFTRTQLVELDSLVRELLTWCPVDREVAYNSLLKKIGFV